MYFPTIRPSGASDFAMSRFSILLYLPKTAEREGSGPTPAVHGSKRTDVAPEYAPLPWDYKNYFTLSQL
jgi:hypothetical protein